MNPRSWFGLVFLAGVALASVALFADPLGLGGAPGFGWKQAVGTGVGLVVAVFGWRRLRQASSDSA